MRSGHLEEILALDPVRDHQRIVYLMACHEFPWDLTRALELALFRTYCVPSISGLLDQTGEFARRPQKRYDDTDLIVSTLMEEGYDGPAGRAALARMNAIHALLDEANRRAFGFPDPPAWLAALATGALRLRAAILRLLPVRRRPRLRTRMPHRSYLAGWTTTDLGPPWISGKPTPEPNEDEDP